VRKPTGLRWRQSSAIEDGKVKSATTRTGDYGSARLGSARLGSARLGSARLGSAKRCVADGVMSRKQCRIIGVVVIRSTRTVCFVGADLPSYCRRVQVRLCRTPMRCQWPFSFRMSTGLRLVSRRHTHAHCARPARPATLVDRVAGRAAVSMPVNVFRSGRARQKTRLR
jgi:hypothetical protein